MMTRHRLWIDRSGVRIALRRWGDPHSDKPPALLLHGTGFVAEVWDEIASPLAKTRTVYAPDRRGHGASDKLSAGQYHFLDFALDLRSVVEGLGLSDILGIGHSAGGTDLLLAAKLLPKRFARLFVIEPTVMVSDCSLAIGTQLSETAKTLLQRTLYRRAEFDSEFTAFQRLRAAPVFAPWSEHSLREYVRHGFQSVQGGRLKLLCTPEMEAAMLLPIFQAMEKIYSGDERGNPFAWLSEIDCPVCLATTELSAPIYKEMTQRALTSIPFASRLSFDGVGHCVAQEAPAVLFRALQAFERGEIK